MLTTRSTFEYRLLLKSGDERIGESLTSVSILVVILPFRRISLVAPTGRNGIMPCSELERVDDLIGSLGDFSLGVLG